MENNLGNIKIMGSGESSGGIFNQVKIMGSGDVDGDLECKELKILGSGDIHGNVKGEVIRVSGSSDIDGNVESLDMKVSGASDIKGNLKCQELKVAGAIDVKGDICSEKIELAGAIELNGDCEAEEFKSSGVFEIDGMLNAGEINIKLRGKSTVREIGGENITVVKNNNTLGKFFKINFTKDVCKLECEVIEGDDIYLEYTTAKVVRGKKIVIGKESKIERVEYTEDFSTRDNAVVNISNKII